MILLEQSILTVCCHYFEFLDPCRNKGSWLLKRSTEKVWNYKYLKRKVQRQTLPRGQASEKKNTRKQDKENLELRQKYRKEIKNGLS